MAKCKGATCGAEIIWARLDNGRGIPLDPEPNPNGNIVVVPGGSGGELPVRYLRKGEEAEGERYVSHFSTCPDSKDFRR